MRGFNARSAELAEALEELKRQHSAAQRKANSAASKKAQLEERLQEETARQQARRC